MTTQLPEVAQALLDPRIYPDKTSKVDMIQTQMSFIFLTGDYVFKLRKAVNLGYLDYTTLEKRHFFSDQELLLNRRLSPQVYLAVIPVTKDSKGLSLNGKGEVLDYVVKMRYLPQDRMMNVLLDRNRVTPEMVEKVAKTLVDFHSIAATNPEISSFGSIEAINYNAEENFSQTEKYINKAITPEQFHRIKEYTHKILKEKEGLFVRRASSGKIKDCHGDMHSQHICFTEPISIFDCIEFNDRFRYCDVASEIAFLAMDIDHFGRADLARTFTDAYIKMSSDSEINEILKFYKCYRAYVRGKVGCFKYDDPYISEQERQLTLETTRGYFELADSYTRSKPRLFITVGLVGSGKSTLAQSLAKRLGLTVISSDVVRKTLASIPLTEHRFEEMEAGLYSPESTRRTYDKLFEDADAILKGGDSVILDASFIKADERLRAEKIANQNGADFYVVECKLDEETTRRRLSKRLKTSSVSDGRWEVYGPQKAKFEPVTEINSKHVFAVDSSESLSGQVSEIANSI